MSVSCILSALISAAAFAVSFPAIAQSRLPAADLNPHLTAPISTWDEALPLGCGSMGMLMWGEGNTLRLSMDRGDLWDERPSKRFTEVKSRFTYKEMQRMAATGAKAEFDDVFDSNYDYDGPPTKLPAGRVEITLQSGGNLKAFDLNLGHAEAVASLDAGGECRGFTDANSVAHPVAMLRLSGTKIGSVLLKSPESVQKLGYPAPTSGGSGNERWFEQQAADGFSYAIAVVWRERNDSSEAAIAVTAHHSESGVAETAHQEALRICRSALTAGYAHLVAAHKKWWAQFWQRSAIQIPDRRIAQQYAFVRYLAGAASRPGAPPMPLQGVWSADAGTLPPWKGDYHNDLNTQMTYIAYRTSGDFEEGRCFLDYLWDRMPVFRAFAHSFFNAPGAAVPGVMSLAGNPLGGWGMYSCSPTMGAWNAHLFYLHWRHTADTRFLKERAYPFCSEIGTCINALLKPDASGTMVLPLSSSPEIFDNRLKAFLKPNTNYDLACMRMLFLSLEEMANKLGKHAEASDWQHVAAAIGNFHKRPDGTLLLDETTPLPESHRHLSNLMALHPFNLITVESGDSDVLAIDQSLKDWQSKGTSLWCGYSFSWMACMRARVGDAEAAFHNLDIYARAFVLRNGFHANGDQTKSGYSTFTYRPFTLEGNFLAMEAVHEMLLQSWSPSPGAGEWGTIRIFPAMPAAWKDASFQDLRAEGGHLISAERRGGICRMVRITAGNDGEIHLRDPFGGKAATWNRTDIVRNGEELVVALRKGEVLHGSAD